MKTDEEELFDNYMTLVRHIFPDIRYIKTSAVSDGNIQIRIEFFSKSASRSDLAIPLSHCGTGLGQALAMLYEVVWNKDSRVFLIDEPQSFLHPGAVRKLLEIFQFPKYSHHQYILTTHSPTALASVRDKTVLLIERENMRSKVKTVDPEKSADLELTLRSVGARLSDVFGMDSIIWVEGETDEACIPLILSHSNLTLFGTKILGLVTTGDLTHKKHGEMAVKIYEKLSKAEGLLPPAMGFVFDGDMKPKLKKLEHEFNKTIYFLRRQNFESYFLEFPNLLEEVLKRESAEESDIRMGKTVSEWMTMNNGKGATGDTEWLESVDGAKYLDKMFNSLGVISYKSNKVKYGREITERILEHKPDHFREIVDLINGILERNSTTEQT